MSHLILPHGSDELRPLLPVGEARQAEIRKAEHLNRRPMTRRGTGNFTKVEVKLHGAATGSFCKL
jgi:hypothetical protein